MIIIVAYSNNSDDDDDDGDNDNDDQHTEPNFMPFLIFQRDHLWSNLGIICAQESFAVLYRRTNAVGTQATGKCFHSFFEFSQIFMSVCIT